MKKYLILLAVLILHSCADKSSYLSVRDLKCDNVINPTGTDILPALSWSITSGERGAGQTAYQVLLDTKSSLLRDNSDCLWNSGKLESERHFGVNPGKELKPATRYFWKVRVWDQNDKPSGWSNEATFVTGLSGEADWTGSKWIGFEEYPDSMLLVPGIHGNGNDLGDLAVKRTVVPYFRKEFLIDKKISDAYLFISGLGQYELFVNGQKADDRFLAPGWTNYEETCYFNSYDLTSVIKKGKNAIGVIAGNGFYNINRERYRKLVIAYGAPKMIAKLILNFDDGTVATLASDETWKSAPSPITFTSIYGGEDYDARLEQDGWDRAGFNDERWSDAIEVKKPSGVLRSESDYPLKVMQEFAPVRISNVNDTSFVYDFGQNCSGIINLKIKGEEGRAVKLWPAELKGKDSLINQNASGYPYFFTYTLSGEGTEEWKPSFTYYGFRYVQVTGAVPFNEPNPGNLPVVEELKLLHTRNSSPVAGTFKCSNEHFNRIYTLIDWSIKSNLASVATDCPHREKLGWLEQTHLMGNSIKYVYDIQNLYNKIVDDMIESQLENGLVPDIAPEYVEFLSGFRDSPEWGSACIIVPWDLYEWYGDIEAIERAYPMMLKYISYLNILAPEGILRHGLGDWYDLGPEFPGRAQLTPRSLTATSIYYYDVKMLSKMARLLGREGDWIYLDDLAQYIRSAFNKEFFNPETSVYSTGSQTAYSMPLFFSITEDSCRKKVVENLISSIRANNNSLTAGDIGYRYLLRVLEQEGQSQLIFEMNSKTDVPGYGFQLAKGATSLTESWAGLTEVSNNHMMLGHLMEWFYSGLAGIRQDESSTAYEHVVICPEIVGDIKWAEATYNSIQGKIVSSWKLEGNTFELKVNIPVGSKATIVLPASEAREITESGSKVESSGLFSNIRTTGDKTYIDIPSGEYSFRAMMN